MRKDLEERYAVIKLKNLNDDQMRALQYMLASWNIARVDCVIVEHDWPMYDATCDAVLGWAAREAIRPYEEARAQVRQQIAEEWEAKPADLSGISGCKQIQPPGYKCTRAFAHTGPCAAVEIDEHGVTAPAKPFVKVREPGVIHQTEIKATVAEDDTSTHESCGSTHYVSKKQRVCTLPYGHFGAHRDNGFCWTDPVPADETQATTPKSKE